MKIKDTLRYSEYLILNSRTVNISHSDNLPDIETDIKTDEFWWQDESSSFIHINIDQELHVVRMVHYNCLTLTYM